MSYPMAVDSHPKTGSHEAARPKQAESRQFAAHHLAALYDINHALTATPNLRAALRRMLEILEREEDVIRATVILTADDNGELRVEAAHGGGQRRLPCPAEPITRRVLDSGRPVIVPQISREPMFSSEAGDGLKRDGSFICVPVLLKGIATGAIAVDLSFKPDRDYDALVGFRSEE